ncbi:MULTISPECIES: hypothetical protein [Actinomadura]|uniref:Uncharacterized protein n=1 Tax=Actinomadura yumaensis TaxID=111807 RepID=A0ABW2CC47_9ACTN|nr:hypothetical protein [Actinomadura sp. J1-007]
MTADRTLQRGSRPYAPGGPSAKALAAKADPAERASCLLTVMKAASARPDKEGHHP